MQRTIAVLQWCKPAPKSEELEKLRREEVVGIPPDWLKKKLGTPDQPTAEFDLLRDPIAYNQVLPSNTKTVPGANVLLHEAPSGSNKAHFRHIRDKEAPLCLACCALGLARLPAFTASEGRGRFPGINQTPPIYFFPQAETLLRTLLSSWPMTELSYDRASWDATVSAVSDENKVGVLEGFTFIPRRVRIAAPSGEDSCVWCGSTGYVATDIAYEKPLKEDAEKIKSRILKKTWRDPQVTYLREPQSKSSDAVDAGSAKAGNCLNDPWTAAGEWRQLRLDLLNPSSDKYTGSPSWLAKAQEITELDGAIEVETVGFATDGKANYFDAWSYPFQVPANIMREAARLLIVREEINWLVDLIDGTINARTASWKDPIKRLRRATFLAGTSPPKRKRHDLRSAICQVRRQIEVDLQEIFLNFIQDIKSLPSEKWEDARMVWHRGVKKILDCKLRLAIAASTSGSPLRRRDSIQRVDNAIREAVRQVEEQMKQAAGKPEDIQPKRGSHESD